MKALFTWLGIFLAVSVNAQTGWMRYFSSSDTLISVQTLPDGYAFLANNFAEVYQIRVDLDGNTLDTVHLGAVPDDIVPAAGGGFFKLKLQPPVTLHLEKLDAAGNLIWQQDFTSPQTATWPRLAALPDGGCYLLSVKTAQNNVAFLSNYVQRISADGVLLWANAYNALMGSGNNTFRVLSDGAVLPDSSVMVLYQDDAIYNLALSGVGQVKADGAVGFLFGISLPDFGDYYFSSVHCAQVAVDGSILAAGSKGSASGGFHPGSTIWGVVARFDPLTHQEDEVQYPPTSSQITTNYGPKPTVAAPMTDGDMLVVVQKNTDTWLWRGSYDLQDTAWQRPLTAAGGFLPYRVKRLNRIMHGTSDHGAIIGGVDNQGVFLQKIGMWGNDSTVTYWPLGGQVFKDLDFDCGTPGPYSPLPNARVHLKSIDPPGFQITVRTDSVGQMNTYVPAGQWQASLAEPVEAIYGKDCLSDTLLWVADSLPAPFFALSAVRYEARLAGRIWSDANSNCLADETGYGFASQPYVILTHEGIDYHVKSGAGGYFSVAVDTGDYQLRIENYDPGPFSGFYCQGDSVYLPSYSAADTITLLWSRWQNSKARVQVLRDINTNCLPDPADPKWKHINLKYSTPSSFQEYYISGDDAGLAVKNIYGPGTVLVEPSNLPDSLLCDAGSWPRVINFAAGPDGQVWEDTLLARYPRWHDSLYVCPGTTIWGVTVDSAALIVQPNIFLWEFQVPFYHHVFALPEIVTELYETLPPGQTDTLLTFVFTAANGCDSTVVIHYVTGQTEPLQQGILGISPNPAQDFIVVELPDGDFETITLCEPAGRVVGRLDGISGQKKVSVQVEKLPDGVYTLIAARKNGARAVGKLIVQH